MSMVVQAVEKDFPTRDGSLAALARVDMSIADGEFLCIVGPSGCGKSTLLSILAGLETPSRGRVVVGGQPIFGPDPSRVMIFQEGALFPWLTARGNIGGRTSPPNGPP
jgi:NitT/TauT family transport system ATP-binding protein